jgi:transposase
MEAISLIGIDLGKGTYHVHAQDHGGNMVLRKAFNQQKLLDFLAKLPPCRVVMEACGGSYWIARKIAAMGHEAKLISPLFVRPFVKAYKHDFADAEAICEAACRPSMRYVAVRSARHQYISVLHRLPRSVSRSRASGRP